MPDVERARLGRGRVPYLFPLLVLLAAALLGFFKVSGTSIGIYNVTFYGPQYHDPNLLLGEPRLVRGDEWGIQTPWIVAQERVGFSPNNVLYIPGQNLTTMNAPVANWAAFFKPWLWPFFLFPLETAFALSWWLRSALLLIASYALIHAISRQDTLLSALGALAFLFSPFLQWWYEEPAARLDVLDYALLACICAVWIFQSARVRHLVLSTVAFAYFSLCFCLVLYPAAQVPIALCCGFVGFGAILSAARPLGSKRVRRAVLALAIAAVVVGLVLAALYLNFRDIVTLVANTLYPGQRRSLGGRTTLLQLLAGAYDVFLLRGAPPRALGPNQSEASSFFMLSVFLIPILLVFLVRAALAHQKADPILIGALAFCLLGLSWMLVGLPDPIARALLLSFVPPRRAWIALGLVNCLLIFYYLSRTPIEITPRYKAFAWSYAIVAFVLEWWIGALLQARSPAFIRGPVEIAIISAAFALLLLLLLLRRKYAFGIGFLLFSLASAAGVNPLYRGLSPLSNSDLSRTVQRIGQQDGGHSTWIVYDGGFGNYLAANGLKVIGGTYAYPDFPVWRQLDPTGQYLSVYNRYGTFSFSAPVAGQAPEFKLLAPDAVQVAIDPCDARLRNLNVNFFVFFAPTTRSCLRQVDFVDYPNLKIYIYQRIE